MHLLIFRSIDFKLYTLHSFVQDNAIFGQPSARIVAYVRFAATILLELTQLERIINVQLTQFN